MSEVKRYRADHRHVVETEFDDAQYVAVSDFEACQSVNRIFQKQLGELWGEIYSLRENLEVTSGELEIASTESHNSKRNEHNPEVAYKAAIERQEELRNELDRIKTISENNFALATDRYFALKAAEQRNAELEKLLSRWLEEPYIIDPRKVALAKDTEIAIMPTESGEDQ